MGSTTTQNFSPAILALDGAMQAGRLRHDGKPMLEWCLGNVAGKADRWGNLYPTKQHPEQEIKAAVAIMMAIGRAMTADDGQPDLMGFLLNGMADVADQEWLTKPMRAKRRSDLEAVSAPRSGPVRYRPTTVAW